MAEVLTKEIANEYKNKAKHIPQNGLQDIGDRRKLRISLQERCNLTELEALNIINGFHTSTYVTIAERRKGKNSKEQRKEHSRRT